MRVGEATGPSAVAAAAQRDKPDSEPPRWPQAQLNSLHPPPSCPSLLLVQFCRLTPSLAFPFCPRPLLCPWAYRKFYHIWSDLHFQQSNPTPISAQLSARKNPFLNCGLNTYLAIVDVPANPSSMMGFFTGGIVVRENVSFFLLFFSSFSKVDLCLAYLFFSFCSGRKHRSALWLTANRVIRCMRTRTPATNSSTARRPSGFEILPPPRLPAAASVSTRERDTANCKTASAARRRAPN